MRPDYTICSKSCLAITGDWPSDAKWDIFISGFNKSERVQYIFDRANAYRKYWLIFPEYDFLPGEFPTKGEIYHSGEQQESEFINGFIDTLGDVGSQRICIDITGFMRPHLLYLVRLLHRRGVKEFDAIYTEPALYKEKDKTTFSSGGVVSVRPVNGFEGSHDRDTSNDLLVISVGYDHDLLAQVAEYKDYANVVPLFGFPSLVADMYQESIFRAIRAGEVIFSRGWESNCFYAPAYDPFATAAAMAEIMDIHERRRQVTNLYLSPLATKPQVLGFALYFILERLDSATSIIFPFSARYDKETSKGMSRIWRYAVELDL